MKNILAADIGGTNSRFAHFTLDEKDTLVLNDTRWLETRKSTSLSHLLGLLNQSEFSWPVDQSDIAVLAVAGPIINGVYSNPPNIPWDIDLSGDLENFIPMRCFLINDFVAQAYACRSPIIHSARRIIPGQIDPSAPLAVIGAGTGLGMAALVPDGDGGYVAVPSEGGHCVFPFESPAEFEFMQFVMDELNAPYVETEFIVSGRGLSLIHQYLAGKKLTPAEVSAAVAQDSETIEWAARFYGRACRNYALQVLARGGVYIAGGVAAKMPILISHPAFERQFTNSKTMATMLQKIPVYLNTNEESGLWGAAFLAAQKLKQKDRRVDDF
jgi:glucokinase